MTDNSQQILADVLQQQRNELLPSASDQDYFEIFCAAQILKDFDLSYEEIQAGIVDGEHDGGIDAVFCFVNGDLVTDDFDPTPFKKDVNIELHIIQSKTSGSFNESTINSLISTTNHLLRLDADYSKLTQYNPDVKAAVDGFRGAYRSLAARFPSLKIRYHYAAKKSDGHVHDNVRLKATEIEAAATALFPDPDVKMEFLGARRLLDLARRRPKTTYELKVIKSLSAVNGHIILANLADYANFLIGDEKKVRAELFESNVRDFQGDTEVNAEIANTLIVDKSTEFWWMNNGVTILASRATLNGDTVTIENPQIVNGLQTSTQMARHFLVSGGEDFRNIMIKIIASDNEETRDKIIKATNSQNAVQPATLRATDKIQRDIEQTLKSHALFYDRRKDFYKNEGKPADKIVSIPLLAQSVMSIILGRPDTARARPSSLIKDKDVYQQIFSENHPIGMYSVAATLIGRVDQGLKSRAALTPRDRSNIRFYVLFCLCCQMTKRTEIRPTDVVRIDASAVAGADISDAIDQVLHIYQKLGASDQVAKGPELRRVLSDALESEFKRTPGPSA